MKQLTLEQLSQQLQDYVQLAQQEQILITQNGKPIALLLGLENFDIEQQRNFLQQKKQVVKLRLKSKILILSLSSANSKKQWDNFSFINGH